MVEINSSQRTIHIWERTEWEFDKLSCEHLQQKIAQSTKFYVKKYMLDQCSKLKVSPSEALTMMALEQLCSAWPHKITENPNATHN